MTNSLKIFEAGDKITAVDTNNNNQYLENITTQAVEQLENYISGFIPDTESQGGKFLKTNGTTNSWETLENGQPFLEYINGLVISKSNNNTILVSKGNCYDNMRSVVLSLSGETTKQNDSQAANTTYYVYIIGNSDASTIDILISAESTAPTLPTEYTLFRQIGYFTTNSSNAIDLIYCNSSSEVGNAWHNSFPSYRYTNLVWVSGQEYTAPADGWFCAQANYKEGGIGFYIKGVGMGNSISNNSGARTYGNISIEVSKGQTIVTRTYSGDGVSVTLFRFVYAKGN